ncbi:putative ubiquitin carboxyl-terminal hydrolase [Clavispora lusitaniae]|uniref:Ubiquitin carboxyl-terminal hydrolase n=1 Tax=Clavispora lusitaniae TaxID=36911 RepID=A0AA91T0H8_CLALS|nr:putative ubiquitin carboxyl-terminal hydrolase [Clavispora lusitaniae]
MSDIEFPVKAITWSVYEQKTPILLQEENGPCPLIALVNTLLLASDIEARTTAWGKENAVFPESKESGSASSSPQPNGSARIKELLNKHVGDRVSLAELLACLGDALLERTQVEANVVSDLLESLPLLHTGLTVNPNLVSGGFPPQDLAAKIFDAFGLTFVHAWIWEPGHNKDADSVFPSLQTFDAVQDFLLTKDEETEPNAEVSAVSAWLDENSTQLTSHGLSVLDKQLPADSVAIFFRNNHFSTLYKADNHDLYLLLTDTAFTKRPDFVWQSVISASGKDDLFFSGDFTPINDELEPWASYPNDDMAVARQLQEEEDAATAQRLQASYNTKKSKQKGTTVSEGAKGAKEQPSKKASKKDTKEGKGKKKGNCVIV